MSTHEPRNQRRRIKLRLALVLGGLWLFNKVAEEIISRTVDLALHFLGCE